VTKTLAIIAALAIGTAAMAQEQPATPSAPPATETAPTAPASPDTSMSAAPAATSNMAAPAATAMQATTPAPPSGDYPKCSAKVHDRCIQSGGGSHATHAKARRHK